MEVSGQPHVPLCFAVGTRSPWTNGIGSWVGPILGVDVLGDESLVTMGICIPHCDIVLLVASSLYQLQEVNTVTSLWAGWLMSHGYVSDRSRKFFFLPLCPPILLSSDYQILFSESEVTLAKVSEYSVQNKMSRVKWLVYVLNHFIAKGWRSTSISPCIGMQKETPSWKPLEPDLSAQCTVRKTQYIIGHTPFLPPPSVCVWWLSGCSFSAWHCALTVVSFGS